MPNLLKGTISFSRWLHTYVSMIGLGAIVLFAFTGLMLSHPRWFGLDKPVETMAQGVLAARCVKPVDRLAIVEALRADYSAAGPVARFSADETSIVVEFAQPGRQTLAEINPATGEVKVTITSGGLAGLLADLHTGRGVDRRWNWVLDATAVALLLSVISGVIVCLSLPRRRWWGLGSLAMGVALCVIAWLIQVTRH
jgi:hypothetical protein